MQKLFDNDNLGVKMDEHRILLVNGIVQWWISIVQWWERVYWNGSYAINVYWNGLYAINVYWNGSYAINVYWNGSYAINVYLTTHNLIILGQTKIYFFYKI